jgi:hypothetical protein
MYDYKLEVRIAFNAIETHRNKSTNKASKSNKNALPITTMRINAHKNGEGCTVREDRNLHEYTVSMDDAGTWYTATILRVDCALLVFLWIRNRTCVHM